MSPPRDCDGLRAGGDRRQRARATPTRLRYQNQLADRGMYTALLNLSATPPSGG